MGQRFCLLSVIVVSCISYLQCQPQLGSQPETLTDLLKSVKEQLPHTCDSLTLVTRVLVEEIEKRVEKQNQMDIKMSQLESKLSQLQPAHQPVAFSAQVRTHHRGLTPGQQILFQDVLTNLGNAYNGDSSVFRCPVNGLYQFVVTILSEPNDRIETELMAAGKSVMKIYSGGITYFGSGSNSVLLSLKERDSVFVRVHLTAGDKLHRLWSTFNGHLVQPL